MMSSNSIIPGFEDEKDASLRIDLERIPSLPTGIRIYLEGYIDTYNSNFFQKKITKVIESGFIHLIFNCSALSYVSSTGIGSFTSFLKILKPRGGDIVLLEIQPKVYEVFQLLGFAQFFNIRETTEDAISFFKNKAATVDSVFFPRVFACPVCSKNLRATHAGRFRCSECKSILAIDEEGQISLG